ncbi:uncharacterized protein LOC115150485 isoform X5 [Salmo trutta]|uniref:uncharacterized protein LOC115150485 isoform X5 n=1 Tax=Salmo trutta TaxID=8032 RepID=UPI0011321495|nr:uncharacterized protein LOC115150485 isoform X5 [Salmo trutta]
MQKQRKTEQYLSMEIVEQNTSDILDINKLGSSVSSVSLQRWYLLDQWMYVTVAAENELDTVLTDEEDAKFTPDTKL